jgi:hypothetical protein
VGAAAPVAEPYHRGLEGVGAPPGDDYPVARLRQALGDRVADAGGAATDERGSCSDGGLLSVNPGSPGATGLA